MVMGYMLLNGGPFICCSQLAGRDQIQNSLSTQGLASHAFCLTDLIKSREPFKIQLNASLVALSATDVWNPLRFSILCSWTS